MPSPGQSTLPGSQQQQPLLAKFWPGPAPPIVNKVTPENTEESVESAPKQRLSLPAGEPTFIAAKTSHTGAKQGGLVGKVKNQFRELIRGRLA